MKTLVIYFSRKNETVKIANAVAMLVDGEVNKIKLAGAGDKINYLSAFISSFSKKIKKIEGAKAHPGNYDRVIFISPIINGQLASAITNYMIEYRNLVKSYSLITTGMFNKKNGAADAKMIFGKDPVVYQHYKYKQIKTDTYDISPFKN